MNQKTVFLAWQDSENTRAWFPIGQLDANMEKSFYRFRYIRGAERARNKVGFQPLLDFPDMEKDYKSESLFPLFSNRIMSSKRPDFAEYMKSLDLPEEANPIEILSVSGGYRATDSYEVFPKLVKHEDGSFNCRFFLHGTRHLQENFQKRVLNLSKGEELYMSLELTNPVTGVGLQIMTKDYEMIGWAPRYLVNDLTKAMAESQGEYEVKVAQVNKEAPSKQKVLVEMKSHWKNHEPMTGEDFLPLVNAEILEKREEE